MRFRRTRLSSTAAAGLLGLVLFSSLPGCCWCRSRGYYREDADEQVDEIVCEKSDDPRWELSEFTIEMDPRSRYYDVNNPNCPPRPEDDPASHEFMEYVDGHKAWPHWDDYGVVDELQNPEWRQYLGQYSELTPDGSIKLGLNNAVHLALIHSPTFQTQLETIYLSALDVSTERFRFDVQFFGSTGPIYQHIGSKLPGGESNTLRLDSTATAQRRFATAGQLLAGFANSTAWEFFGPNSGMTTSILNFNLVQPLLRAGSRVIGLEQLTIAERGLLANLRAFQRYRQGFYTQVAIGDSSVSGPQRQGGFFGGTGLTGFTGQGSGGFGGVGDATGFGRTGVGGGGAGGAGGTAGFAGGGAGTVGGYLGLLQQAQQIRNTQDSLGAQLRTLSLLEANLAAGLIDIAQVDQFRQNIETERANLLQSQNSLENSMDAFKASTLGLPPNLAIELDDTLIQPFRFLDPRITRVQDEIATVIDEFGEFPREPEIAAIEKTFDEITAIRPHIAAHFDIVRQDLTSMDSAGQLREKTMSPAERKLMQTDREQLAKTLAEIERRFQATSDRIGQLKAQLNPSTRVATADGIVALLVDLSNMASELSLVQARARIEGITLETVQLESGEALEIARAHRLDWMNNRAGLVDTWRLIEFNANALKSNLTITLSGSMQTVGNDNPLKFSHDASSLRAQLQYDPPLTRLIERNNFRQQLIEYQRDRRQLIQFEDGINRTLRTTLRQLKQLEVNLEIQRRAVAIAIRRVDQTREVLNRPVPPSLPGAAPAQLGPTAALNLLTALSDLRNTQNNFMSVWLNYQASRMLLMRELGIMRLTEDGIWIDEPLDEALQAAYEYDEYTLPPTAPSGWMGEAVPYDDAEPGRVSLPPAPASPDFELQP